MSIDLFGRAYFRFSEQLAFFCPKRGLCNNPKN